MVRSMALIAFLLAPVARGGTINTEAVNDGLTFKIQFDANFEPPGYDFGRHHAFDAQSTTAPWASSVTGHVDTQTLLWTRDSIAIDPLPAAPMSLTSTSMDLVATYSYDPPGFDPPVVTTATVNGVTFTMGWEWASILALEIPQQLALDPTTLSTGSIELGNVPIGRLRLTFNGGAPYELVSDVLQARAQFGVGCQQGPAATCTSDLTLGSGTQVVFGLNVYFPEQSPATIISVEGGGSFSHKLIAGIVTEQSRVPEPSIIGLLLAALGWGAVRRARVRSTNLGATH